MTSTRHAQPEWTRRDAPMIAPPRRADVTTRRVDGELLLFDPATAITFHLNPTAATVWSRCDGRTSAAAVARRLAGDYDVEYDVALNDVEEVIVWLCCKGLCEGVAPP